MSNGRTATFTLLACVAASCSPGQPRASTQAGEATHPSKVPSSVPATTVTSPSTRPTVLAIQQLTEMIKAYGTRCDSRYVDKFPDYTFYLRAELSLAQWREVEERMKTDGWMSRESEGPWEWFEFEERPTWWTPTTDIGEWYMLSLEQHSGIIKYENGFVFYRVTAS